MPVAFVIKRNNWLIIRLLTLYRLCFASFFSFVSRTVDNPNEYSIV